MSGEEEKPFTLSDIFGGGAMRLIRPNTADFWRLSEIILAMDGRMDETPDDEQQALFGEYIGAIGDSYAISYMAIQRAMRVLGVRTAGELKQKQQDIALLSSVYVEGLIVGAQFAQRGGHRDSPGDHRPPGEDGQ